MINYEEIYTNTLEHFKRAQKSILLSERAFESFQDAISDTIPGYEADLMEFGDYAKDNFAVLFIDMRNSTKRAMTIGKENTFLTMHAYIPAMLEVIKNYSGVVIDIMGDGIMVFFGGQSSTLTKVQAIQNAGLCGCDMLKVKDCVTNKILKDNGIAWGIDCGVGVDYGDVIVTKIGINQFFDVKAYGDCVNKASKYSDEVNKVKVSKAIRENWPKGEGGKLHFLSSSSNDAYIISRD